MSTTIRRLLLTLGVLLSAALLRADAITGTITEVAGNVATIKTTTPQLPKVGDRVEAIGMIDGPGTELVVGRGRVIEVRDGVVRAKMEGADPPPRGQAVRIVADAAGPKAEAGPAAQVERIEIVERGTYRPDLSKTKGQRSKAASPIAVPADALLVKDTTTIPVRKGLLFGMKYVVSGAPKGAKAPLKIVVVYPEGRSTAGKAADKREETVDRAVGPTRYFWGLKVTTEEAMAGVWTCQIWCQDRKLAEQKFTLVRP